MATTAPPDGNPKGLSALTAAVEKHAKLQLLATQLPERLAQARAEVEEAYRQLGLEPPSRGGPPTTARGQHAGRPPQRSSRRSPGPRPRSSKRPASRAAPSTRPSPGCARTE